MKRIFLTASVLFLAISASFADKYTINNDPKETREAKKELRKERRAENRKLVSGFIMDQFARDFPAADNVIFCKTKNFDEVSFTQDGKELTAYYDANSKLVGTTEQLTLAALPENAQKKITEKYAGYSITDVIKFDDNENNDTGMILNGTALGDADNYFAELKNGDKAMVVKIDMTGDVSFSANMK